MNVLQLVAAAIAVVLLIYLTVAMLAPERFE
ncbi:MAG: K(+)-transporting ATPase subunit F [Planctomycetes bacterium]|nr:K(+)-transporting ATPase subunit F [Planctomycetota bacterium]